MNNSKFDKPVDVLRDAMNGICVRDYKNVPGDVILKLTKEQRDIIFHNINYNLNIPFIIIPFIIVGIIVITDKFYFQYFFIIIFQLVYLYILLRNRYNILKKEQRGCTICRRFPLTGCIK